MFLNQSGKVIFITGASSGIGEALAHFYFKKGAHLVLCARRLDRLQQLRESFKKEGQEVLIFQCDVTSETDLKKAVESSLSKLGRIDTVIANAGFGIVGDIDRLTLAQYQKQFDTNIYGVIRTVQATLPEIKKTKGRIGIVGSVNGYIALPGNSPYAMSKFAVRAFAKSLRYEMKPFGVSVTHIAPGFIETEIRKVDNRGVYHPESKDKIPHWLQMKADVAARKIACAVQMRLPERVVTAHGQFAVWIERFFPFIFAFLINQMGLKARPEPAK